MTNALDRLGVTREEMDAAHETLAKQRLGRDGRICVCGHSARAHTEHVQDISPLSPHFVAARRGERMCKPSKTVCPCQSFQEVLEAGDVRKFKYRTTGPGSEHALTKGIRAILEIGQDVTWKDEGACFSCSRTDVAAYPVAINRLGFESKEPESDNRLLCADCRMEQYNTALDKMKSQSGA